MYTEEIKYRILGGVLEFRPLWSAKGSLNDDGWVIDSA